MKMIIDIDERAYAGCVKLKSNDDMGVLGFHLINATANGTPLIEELEKIKAEIELTKCNKGCLPRIIAECNISKSNREWCEYYYCLKIINKHISELKGEN